MEPNEVSLILTEILAAEQRDGSGHAVLYDALANRYTDGYNDGYADGYSYT